jgi:hypothetical protein
MRARYPADRPAAANHASAVTYPLPRSSIENIRDARPYGRGDVTSVRGQPFSENETRLRQRRLCCNDTLKLKKPIF